MTIWDATLPFDTDDREFVRGVQVGMMWLKLRAAKQATEMVSVSPFPLAFVTYAENAEMCLRMAERLELSVRCDPGDERPDDEWMEVWFS